MVLDMSHVSNQGGKKCSHSRCEDPHPVSYPNSRPPEATKIPIMMAGADEPATLSGFRQPMAKAMADGMRPSSQGGCVQAVEDGNKESLEESTPSIAVDHLREFTMASGGGDQGARQSAFGRQRSMMSGGRLGKAGVSWMGRRRSKWSRSRFRGSQWGQQTGGGWC